jgi:hypothetical protein
MIMNGSKNIFLRRLAHWLPWIFTVAFVLRSRPFMKLPYDMWHHLMLIRGWFSNGAPYLTMPPDRHHEVAWHWFWAKIFQVIHVDDVFLWANIIHTIQFAWTLFCLWFFCNVILKACLPETAQATRRLSALLGAWMFVLGAGTFSVQYQLSWMLWYGVNYQGFTLPAYFLAMGLVLENVAGVTSRESNPNENIRWLLVMGLIALIVVVHPLEASYFMLNTVLVCLIFPDRLRDLFAKNKVKLVVLTAAFISIPLIIHFLPSFGVVLPVSHGMRLLGDPQEFWRQMIATGTKIQSHGMHRGLTSFTELAITGCALLILIAVTANHLPGRSGRFSIPNRLLIWAAASAVVFGLASRMVLTSGFLGVMTVDEQVWRYAFASPWFVGFSLWSAKLLGRRQYFMGVILALTPLLMCFCVSRFILSGPFNTTAASLFRSLELRQKDSVGIQFNKEALRRLDNKILAVTSPNNGKKNLFFVRSDLQAYIRAATGAYIFGGRLWTPPPDMMKSYENDYELVIVPPPQGLPIDPDMKNYFPTLGL